MKIYFHYENGTFGPDHTERISVKEEGSMTAADALTKFVSRYNKEHGAGGMSAEAMAMFDGKGKCIDKSVLISSVVQDKGDVYVKHCEKESGGNKDPRPSKQMQTTKPKVAAAPTPKLPTKAAPNVDTSRVVAVQKKSSVVDYSKFDDIDSDDEGTAVDMKAPQPKAPPRPPPQKPKDPKVIAAEQCIDAADSLRFEKGQISDARRLYVKALESDKRNAVAMKAIADIDHANGFLDSAASWYDRAMLSVKHSNDAIARLSKTTALLTTKKLGRRILSGGDNGMAGGAVGGAVAATNKYDPTPGDAPRDFLPGTILALAQVHMARRDFEPALKLLQSGLSLNGSTKNQGAKAGSVTFFGGPSPGMIVDLKVAMARLLLEAGRAQDAADLVQATLTAGFENHTAGLLVYADVAHRYDKVSEALSVLLRVVVSEQTNKTAAKLLSRVLAKGTKSDERFLAICAAEKSLEESKATLDAKDKERLAKARNGDADADVYEERAGNGSSSSSSSSSGDGGDGGSGVSSSGDGRGKQSSPQTPVTAASLALERQKQREAVLAAAAAQPGSAHEGLAVLQQQVPLTKQSASAYAFLATLAKENGAVDTSVALLRLASQADPASHSYALNYVHGFEMCNAYEEALAAALAHLRRNPSARVGKGTGANKYGAVSCAQVLAALEAACRRRGPLSNTGATADGGQEDAAITVAAATRAAPSPWRLVWHPDSEVSAKHNATVSGGDAAAMKFDSHVELVRLDDDAGAAVAEASTIEEENKPDSSEVFDEPSMDLLALFFTITKILYVSGAVEAAKDVIAAVEPTRRRSAKPIHSTNIRNEHAYYCCIAQCLSAADHEPAVSPLAADDVNGEGGDSGSGSGAMIGRPIYVCGDSHALSPAWKTIALRRRGGQKRLLKPALVTGLKHWHLRPGADFYPKRNFQSVVATTIPDGADVVFLFGEIDCREGILVAVAKGRYPSVEAGMVATMAHFFAVVEELRVKRKFRHVFIHPIVPVLNETRAIVTQYNALFKERVRATNGRLLWLDDVFEALLTPDGTALRPEYHFDGTHLHPCYLSLLGDAIDKCNITSE